MPIRVCNSYSILGLNAARSKSDSKAAVVDRQISTWIKEKIVNYTASGVSTTVVHCVDMIEPMQLSVHSIAVYGWAFGGMFVDCSRLQQI